MKTIENKRVTQLGWVHLIIAITFCYIIPFGPEYEALRVRAFVFAPLIVFLFLNKLLFKDVIIIFLVGVLMSAFLLADSEKYATLMLGYALMVYLILLSENEYSYKKGGLQFLVILLCVLFTYHIDINHQSHERAVTSIGDPNFSSYYLLLIFFLAQKIGSRIAVLYALSLGLLFLSKNFYLAIIIYYLSVYFKSFIYDCSNKFKVKSGFYLVASHVVLIVLGLTAATWDVTEPVLSDGIERLSNIANASDKTRLTLNVEAVREVFSDLTPFLFGVDLKYFHATYSNYPHNALLFIMLANGFIYMFLLFSIIVYAINKRFSEGNIPYIFSYFVFGLFLHSNYYLFGFIIFYLIISIKPNSSNERNGILKNTLLLITKKTAH